MVLRLKWMARLSTLLAIREMKGGNSSVYAETAAYTVVSGENIERGENSMDLETMPPYG